MRGAILLIGAMVAGCGHGSAPWTAGKLEAATIETGFGSRALAKGWIHVEWGYAP